MNNNDNVEEEQKKADIIINPPKILQSDQDIINELRALVDIVEKYNKVKPYKDLLDEYRHLLEKIKLITKTAGNEEGSTINAINNEPSLVDNVKHYERMCNIETILSNIETILSNILVFNENIDDIKTEVEMLCSETTTDAVATYEYKMLTLLNRWMVNLKNFQSGKCVYNIFAENNQHWILKIRIIKITMSRVKPDYIQLDHDQRHMIHIPHFFQTITDFGDFVVVPVVFVDKNDIKLIDNDELLRFYGLLSFKANVWPKPKPQPQQQKNSIDSQSQNIPVLFENDKKNQNNTR